MASEDNPKEDPPDADVDAEEEAEAGIETKPHWKTRIGPLLTAWLGSGRFVPVTIVGVGLAGAAWQFVSNPFQVDLESLEKIKAGDSLGIDPTIHLGLHLGSLIAMILLGGWLLLAPWWARLPGGALAATSRRKPRRPKEKAAKENPAVGAKRSPDGLQRTWFWTLVILAVLAGGVLRYPRLFHSFWNDEEVAHRKFIHGSHRIGEGGEAEFKPVSWKRTWFYNVTGNNHVLQSVGSRATLDLFGGDSNQIDEPLTRVLPLAAGLLTIVAVAVLLRQAGAGFAGVVAAWLLALHPWHLRYSVEARGYSLMLLFAAVIFVFLAVAMKRKSWLAWAIYGVCQLACLLCFPAAIYLVVAVNIGVLTVLAVRRDGASFKRWSTVCVVGAAAFFQIMTPSLLRMVEWIASPYEVPRALGAPYFLDLWSHVAAGLPLSDGHGVNAFRLDLDSWRRVGSLRYWLVIALLPVLVIAGCVWAIVKRPSLRWPLVAVAAAVGLAILHVQLKPMVFHGWYLLYLLLPFCIGLAMVVQPAWEWKRPVGLIAALALFLVYGTVALAPIKRQRGFERHPLRTAVMRVRGEAPALSSAQVQRMTVSVGPGSGQLAGYDPRVVAAKNEAVFFAEVERARVEGKQLSVYCSHSDGLAQSMPKVATSLNDPSLFREVDYVLGVEAFWSIRIFEPVEAGEEEGEGNGAATRTAGE